MKGGVKKRSLFDLRGQLQDIWNKLLTLHASPHSIGLGLALGMFIGFLPIMGIQMAVVLVFAMPFKNANKVAAVSGVWISNPLTVVPIYAFIYWIGTFFYPEGSVLSYSKFSGKFRSVIEMEGFVAQTKGFFDLGADIFVPMFIGGGVVGIFAGVLSYFAVKHFIKVYREKTGVCKIYEEDIKG
jgi:uncharacterized protein